MTNYYIYYRVDPSRLAEVRASIDELLAAVERQTGIRGRWMRSRDDATTCMEVYEGVQDDQAFDAVLEREAGKLGLERKVERFVCA